MLHHQPALLANVTIGQVTYVGCHETPCKAISTALLRPRWASLVTSFTPQSPRPTKERRKEVQNASSSLGPTSPALIPLSPVSPFTPTAITTAVEATRPSWRFFR